MRLPLPENKSPSVGWGVFDLLLVLLAVGTSRDVVPAGGARSGLCGPTDCPREDARRALGVEVEGRVSTRDGVDAREWDWGLGEGWAEVERGGREGGDEGGKEGSRETERVFIPVRWLHTLTVEGDERVLSFCRGM